MINKNIYKNTCNYYYNMVLYIHRKILKEKKELITNNVRTKIQKGYNSTRYYENDLNFPYNISFKGVIKDDRV